MATETNRTLAVVWPRFGPYHLVRLEAASVRLASEGWKVLGVEVARTDREYAWAVVKGARQFERVTLWQNRDYQDLRYDELRREMARTPDLVDPAAADVGQHGHGCPARILAGMDQTAIDPALPCGPGRWFTTTAIPRTVGHVPGTN